MSKIRYVAGKVTKITGGDYNMFSGGNINSFAKTVIEKADLGTFHGEPENLPEGVTTLKGSLNLKINTNDFVPLGIVNFNKERENEFIKLEVEIIEGVFNSFDFYIFKDGSYKSIGTVATNSSQKEGDIISFEWDGFIGDEYDSEWFNSNNQEIKVKGYKDGIFIDYNIQTINTQYKEVKWVDVKINKNSKRIDVTLRVNLKDGGAIGLTKTTGSTGLFSGWGKQDPWDRIPKKDLLTGKPPLKTQTKSFKDLEKLTLEGLAYHWGRNRNHVVAKDVSISNEKYEIFVHPVNTKSNAMDDVELIFNTNNSWMRSGNPGTVDDPISFIGNLVSREAICYNVGYIKGDRWGYVYSDNENTEFQFTSAHEIGHTILKAYGGTFYSYGHKDSVNTVTQNIKSKAPEYPRTGEIDIMPYYPYNPPLHFYNRYATSEKDVLSLIWLTKTELK